MFKITTKLMVQNVCARWRAQYPFGQDVLRDAIYNKLAALPVNATSAEVFDIIGNASWTRINCSECQKDVERVMILASKDSDGDAYVCTSCLEKALERIKED